MNHFWVRPSITSFIDVAFIKSVESWESDVLSLISIFFMLMKLLKYTGLVKVSSSALPPIPIYLLISPNKGIITLHTALFVTSKALNNLTLFIRIFFHRFSGHSLE